MIIRRLLLAGSLLLAGVVPGVLAKSDGPEIKVKEFDKVPTNVYYFEDTDTILLQAEKANIYISTDAAGSWDILKGKSGLLWPNKFHTQSAVIYGPDRTHWVTYDAAKTWHEFKVPEKLLYDAHGAVPFTFHGKDPNKVIINAEECLGGLCRRVSYYTTDGFKTVKKLFEGDSGCYWAVGNPVFGEDMDLPKEIDDRIFCIWPRSLLLDPYPRLVYSDKFFSDDKAIAVEVNGRAFRGTRTVASIKKFLVIASTSERTSEAAIYVSKDATHWERTEFYGGPKVRGGFFTFLGSTNYSLQVNVASRTSKFPIGTLFTSDSNGTSFTMNVDSVNEDEKMYTDFEQVSGIQGIFLINKVDNSEEVRKGTAKEKKLVSRISFDDGRTFKPLKYKDKEIHLHSITRPSNSGLTFSSPAPGLIMGVGNSGDSLGNYDEGNLYVSDDAGISWRKALDKPHKYEFGDQGSLLIAIFDRFKDDDDYIDEISYSLNHGKDWKKAKLPHKVTALQLTTTPDSTSLQFLLVAEDKDKKFYVMSIDFSNLHERKCEKKDFERWPARLDEKGEPDCLMGHKQFYTRRKADADCFVKEKFKEALPETEPCKCTKEDFECAAGFKRNSDYDCEQQEKLKFPEGQCKNPDDKFMGPSGYRMIPGNDCIKKGGADLEKDVERVCKETTKAPASGDISVEPTTIKTGDYRYRYLERGETSSGDDETVILITDKGKTFLTKDHGKTWLQHKDLDPISGVSPHTYDDDVIYLLTSKKKGYWSVDRGHTFKPFEVESPATQSGVQPLTFHPKNSDWLIWTGHDCDGEDCNDVAYYSSNRGAKWDLILRGVRKCTFTYTGEDGKLTDPKLIFCEQHKSENKKKDLQLVSSKDMFAEKTTHFNGEPIVGFAKMAEFIVAAVKDGKDLKELKSFTSVDGKTFAHAAFPPNFHVDAQRAYTVMDSSTHSVFLHVTENNEKGHEFGSILKSNSNGTSYVLSLSGANRNANANVDFEKMQSIEGVAIANVVANTKEVNKGEAKKLRTMITHNDGAEWALIPPPKKDAEGHSFDCKVKGEGTDECALHLHTYTERRDLRDTLSSGSAVGLMVGIGNVGPFLSPRKEADTFMTSDGGITWHAVKKGRYQWEYGDQGSIVALVAEDKPTKTISYSLDEGKTWKDFEFTNDEITIEDISTVPSDTSLNFLLWGRKDKSELVTFNVDFSGLKEREKQCVLKKESPEADDYYLWSPKHPLQKDNCLFGHISLYHRKKPEAKCFNGPKLDRISGEKKNCECTRRDYECDYNYEPRNDGSCALVPGLKPANPKQVCKDDPDAIEYFDPTGYRRNPMSTCQGGLQLDHIVARPCPDKDKEFEEKHPGISGLGLFFAVFFPLAAATAVGYYAFSKWDGKFGRIRLGESGPETIFAGNSPLISIPVAIVAGTVAVFTALPLLFSSLWRSLRGYSRVPGRGQRPYASRGAFAARRGDYVGVVDDEDELLGSEEFEGEEDDEV